MLELKHASSNRCFDRSRENWLCAQSYAVYNTMSTFCSVWINDMTGGWSDTSPCSKNNTSFLVSNLDHTHQLCINIWRPLWLFFLSRTIRPSSIETKKSILSKHPRTNTNQPQKQSWVLAISLVQVDTAAPSETKAIAFELMVSARSIKHIAEVLQYGVHSAARSVLRMSDAKVVEPSDSWTFRWDGCMSKGRAEHGRLFHACVKFIPLMFVRVA
jgi:hypothetical protein